jgi:NSS family neurotransmitter:Na+ symporter
MPQQPSREHWGSRIGFILAAAGSAIGLGNIWKFPFITGLYGGAAFVMVYLVCILLIGAPVMLIEFAIGRKTQRNPVGAYESIAGERSLWTWVGGLGVLAGFVILSYYSVVAGWCLGYVIKSIGGAFSAFSDPAEAGAVFEEFSGSPSQAVSSHAIFMLLCILVVARGVKSGIEKAARVLMPTLLAILVMLVFRGLTLEGSGKGVEFLFRADFSKLTGDAILVALGHAFFTLSLGMGAMITYGSYLSRQDNLISSAVWVLVLDTGIALMAGLAIFSAVFAYGLDPAAGEGLIFHVLPVVFGQMPGGAFFAFLFFVLLSIAAVTSGISLLEVVIAYLVDEKGWKRPKATWVFGTVILVLGIPSALSFGPMANVKIGDWTFFQFFDYMSFKYMLPLGGLLSILFVLGRWKVVEFLAELRKGSSWWLPGLFLARLALGIAAVLMVITFIAGLFGKA